MHYLVTGATGFIGRHVVEQLLKRGGTVHALVREASQARLMQMAADRFKHLDGTLVPVVGDIGAPSCGLSPETIGGLAGKIDHVIHLAAIYDMEVDLETARVANVEGTRHVVELANALNATMDHVSSIAVAGDYPATFREDMFDEGQKHRHPYFKTKFEAEALVRQEAKRFRVYRPGIVIGSSKTGVADKLDGPYYAFKLIQKLRGAFPQWFPLVGIEGGRLHLVPVDFVAEALVHILHQEGLDGQAFHLTDPKPHSVGDALNIFSRAAHAPQFSARIDNKVFNLVPNGITQVVRRLPAVQNVKREVMGGLGIPASLLDYIDWKSTFDTRDTAAALNGSGIVCPDLKSYSWKIWDYYERHMDPDLYRDRTLAGKLRGKKVLITGASSGIGKTLSMKVAAAGGIPLLVARSVEKLVDTKKEIQAGGGTAHVYPADLSIPESCDELVATVIKDHGGVDFLINNAGRSIRRTIANSYDRFHDFDRTIKLNYFGSLKLILGLLPGMRERRGGHIVNISSIGVQTNAPRFSAYVASKAALDSFSRSIASEVIKDQVHITTVYMPLVRTPMIAPTKIYEAFPAISPDEAADMVLNAFITKQKRVATRLGTFGEVAYAVSPRAVDYILSIGFRLFPDNLPGEKGKPAEEQPVSMEGVAFAHLLKGIHW